VLPAITNPEEWRLEQNTLAVAEHLIQGMQLDVSASDLEDDIIGALSSSSEIIFEWAASVQGSCELHGTYSPVPPRIRVKRSSGTARGNFTAAHELGHHLQSHDADWALGVLADLRRTKPFIARDVEERVSNQVAARLLLPDQFVDSQWKTRLTPDFVRALTRDGRVSRWAASIRAAGRAEREEPGPFVIVVARLDGVVTSAVASNGSELAPPGRGSVQPDLATLAAGEPGHGRAREGIIYGSGVSRADVGYDWCWDFDGSHVIAIVRTEYRFGKANWGDDDTECASVNCETVFSRSEATHCETCMQPVCPVCSACGCERTEGGICTKCFMVMSIAETQNGAQHVECPL
jgi:hypothetical protein